MFPGAPAGAVVGFRIHGRFGGVGEVAVEAEAVVVAVEHCADEGGFHGVEEVHMLLLSPKRCRFSRWHVHRRVHRCRNRRESEHTRGSIGFKE